MNGEFDQSTWEWLFLTRFPPRELKHPRYMDSFRKLLQSYAQERVDFVENLRRIALAVTQQDDARLIRQGLQCLAHVGLASDISTLEPLTAHGDSDVAADARTCIFEIRSTPRQFHES